MELCADPKYYIGKEFECDCGKRHSAALEDIAIGSGEVGQLAGILQRHGFQKPLVVSDVNTERVFGGVVKECLGAAGISFGEFVFPDEELVADADSIGRLLIEAHSGYDLLLGVGAGTINDLCKYVGCRTRRPSIIVATAASMDGFDTSVAILLLNKLKTTVEAQMPVAVLGDVDVIRNAPMEMLAAGVGDMLGKYVSLLDWKIASMVTGDYYCQYSADIVEVAAKSVVDCAGGIASRDADVVGAVMNGLVLSGFAMAYNGSSQPGSGAEHQLAHFWDVRFAELGRKALLHGTKVGIGSVVATRLFELLAEYPVDFDAARRQVKSYNSAVWQREIHRAYGTPAGAVLQLEQTEKKNDPQQVLARLDVLQRHWAQLMELAKKLPSSGKLAALLQSMDAPYSPVQVGIDRQMFLDCVYYAKDMRHRYGLLQILFDLGLQQQLGNVLADELY